MIVLLLPLVAAILICDVFHPLRKPWQKTPPNALQTTLYQRLADTGLADDELATVGALTLGYKEDLEPELKRHFQASGAAHVLAVSGLHTGIIYGLLLWLLTLGGRFKPLYENRWGRWTISLIIIAAMWGYAWLTGMTPSVVRAVLMVTIFEIGRMAYRQAFSLNTIAAAAVLILLIHPSDLWNISFQLSFAATFSIVAVAGTIRYFDLSRSRSLVFRKLMTYIIGILIVSLAAQLGTIPITAFYFKQMSVYFLLTNLIVLPLASILVPLGLTTIALGGCGLGTVIGKATWGVAWLMNHSVEWIESLPGCTVQMYVNGWMIAVYYVLLMLFYVFVHRKNA
jgi:competence protein ComEC